MQNSNQGGKRYRHADGGRIIRAIWEDQRRRGIDARANVLVSIGLLLAEEDEDRLEVVEHHPLTVGRFREGETEMYYVETHEKTVLFSALHYDQTLEYTTYTPGPWETTLEHWAEVTRTRRRQKKPELAAVQEGGANG